MARTRVVGTRALTLWLLVIIAASLIAGVSAMGVYGLPWLLARQSLDQHYRAGVAFQDLGEWADAEASFKEVIRLDADYRDVQERLAQVKAQSGAGGAAPAPALTLAPTPTEEATVSTVEITMAVNGERRAWTWLPGLSEASGYELFPGGDGVTLTAGPGTDFKHSESSAPRLEIPASGDFVAQARVDFSPRRPDQAVGLGVRDTEPSGDWIALRRHTALGTRLVSASQRQGNLFQDVVSRSYPVSQVYLRIVRREGRFWMSYSGNGNEWIELRTDYELPLPDQVQVFLFVASPATSQGATAMLSELRFTEGY